MGPRRALESLAKASAEALAALLAAAGLALAVELPDSWRCPKEGERVYWEGVRAIPAESGPRWGAKLNDKISSPFIWLVIYQHRDLDLAERRAPIEQRWNAFTPDEKCAYLSHYAGEAAGREKEYAALLAWRQDRKLQGVIADLDGGSVAAAQEGERLKDWHARFAKTKEWIEREGVRDEGEGEGRERAWGVFSKLGLLDAAYWGFKQASGHYEALVRRRAAELFADLKALGAALAARGAKPELVALLEEEPAREHAIRDLSDQLSRDPDNPRLLGTEIEPRLIESLRALKIQRDQRATKEKAEAFRLDAEQRQAALRKAEAAVAQLEQDLLEGKWEFGADADPKLLVGLEEYRQGRKELYALLKAETDAAKLRDAYRGLLRRVCETHYTSLRYKRKLIDLLCGKP